MIKAIKNLSNTELVKEYKIARKSLIEAKEGTPEEKEIDKYYSELFKEINIRNLDLRLYM